MIREKLMYKGENTLSENNDSGLLTLEANRSKLSHSKSFLQYADLTWLALPYYLVSRCNKTKTR